VHLVDHQCTGRAISWENAPLDHGSAVYQEYCLPLYRMLLLTSIITMNKSAVTGILRCYLPFVQIAEVVYDDVTDLPSVHEKAPV